MRNDFEISHSSAFAVPGLPLASVGFSAETEFKIEDIEQSIAARFEQVARRHEQRLAVKSGAIALSYGELNRGANRVARALLAKQQKEDRPVALLFKQGASMIRGSLAALKAGRISAPIDGAAPLARARAILEDSRAALIATDDDHVGFARDIVGDAARVLNIDDLGADYADDNPALPVAPERPAFIHYTSGSSGAPKGVVGSHRSELASIRLKTRALRISPEDRISLLRSANVGATSDMLLALLNGAAAVALELNEEGLARLARWLMEEEITVFTCVASVYRYCARSLSGGERFPTLRLIHLGGEPVFTSDVELYKKYFSEDCRLVTRLGISETRTAAYYFIDKTTPIRDVVPAGYPLDGYEIQILDERGEMRKDHGAVGEIAIKSEHLAEGYWRRPQLTREKFLPDPQGGRARIYRTGDLGYLTEDGCLVHVGRIDAQVKIRGHRVEPAEIEKALLELPEVCHAAVLPWDEGPERRRLAAYVVLRPGAKLAPGEIRAHLKQRLPGYMVPAAIRVIDRLPLTAGGKLDRRALAAPARPRSAAPYRAPSDAVERVLVFLWSEVFSMADIGVDDDFFDLGGDSIGAARLLSRVRETFLPNEAPRLLDGAATVSRMARWLAEHESAPGSAEKIAAIFLRVQNLGADELSRALGEPQASKGDDT